MSKPSQARYISRPMKVFYKTVKRNLISAVDGVGKLEHDVVVYEHTSGFGQKTIYREEDMVALMLRDKNVRIEDK